MERLFVWLLRLTIGTLVLGAVVLGLLYVFLSRSIPDYDAELEFATLPADVEIIRNTANVPHVFGQTDAATFFGLGYAHAQDRLWQMTMLRRTAQGRLSEVFGTETLPIDLLIRRLDIYTLSRQSVGALRPDTRSMLQAYADGVNARIAEINSEALGRGAPEFFLFSNAIAPWQPADSVAVIKLMGLQLSGHLEEEVIRARTSLIIENDRLRDILPSAPGEGVLDLPEYAALFPGMDGQETRFASVEPHALSPFKQRGLAGASNAWAAAQSRSARSGTLLANDPHLGLTAPAIWYLARLELETGGVIGGTIPGLPVVLVGRSDVLGWGLTSSYVDDQDVLIEKLNPENPKEYLTPNGYRPFRTRQSIIEIADAQPVTLELTWTDNGPVLPGSHYDLDAVTPDGHVAALSWTLLSGQDTSVEAGMDLMRSRSIEEGLQATQTYVAPAQNLTLVDQDSIALKVIGALPNRHPQHQSRGRMPAPGWIAENRWQGIFDPEVNPSSIDPVGGILGNTNNKPVSRAFPEHLSYVWGDTQRIQRWARLMQNRRVHTRDSFIEAQLDTVSPTARTLLPLIGADLWFQTEAAEPGTLAERRQNALNLLANWNGEMSEHLPEPLIYAAWVRALQIRMIQDELGPLVEEYPHLEPLLIERAFRNVDGAAKWCDVLQSAPVETCADMARVALDDALITLSERYGNDVAALRWGDAHEATHDHPVLGKVPVLKWFVNIRQSTSGGDNTLLRGRTIGTGPNPFLNVHAAGYRGVYDFADPDSSVFVISTGQSGHPLSRYYDDLGELWRRGEYIPMSLDPELARAGGVGITRLSPARSGGTAATDARSTQPAQ